MTSLNFLPIFLTMGISPLLQIGGFLILFGSLAFLGFLALPKLSEFLLERFASSPIAIAYKQIVEPSLSLIQTILGMAIADIFLLLVLPKNQASFLEFILGLSIAVALCYLGYQLISRFLRFYVEETIDKGRKIDADLFLVSKFLLTLAIFFIIITIFAETHKIDIFGLLASIGIGGVAIAFAAQTILEQIIGGFVLFF